MPMVCPGMILGQVFSYTCTTVRCIHLHGGYVKQDAQLSWQQSYRDDAKEFT